jgi:acetyl-CoA carboxylase biotin carboxyl carrier protein
MIAACRPLRWRAPWPKTGPFSGDQQHMAVVNVKSEIAGNVWKIQLKPGDKVEAEGEIMILESMKMEIPVLSPRAGTIKEIRVSEGEAIGEGQLVAVLDA